MFPHKQTVAFKSIMKLFNKAQSSKHIYTLVPTELS